jgi:hypothetical protein
MEDSKGVWVVCGKDWNLIIRYGSRCPEIFNMKRSTGTI